MCLIARQYPFSQYFLGIVSVTNIYNKQSDDINDMKKYITRCMEATLDCPRLCGYRLNINR